MSNYFGVMMVVFSGVSALFMWVHGLVFLSLFFSVNAISLMTDVAIKTFWILLKSPCYIQGKVCTISYLNLLHIKEANEC